MADHIKKNIKDRVSKLEEVGIKPKLRLFRLGDNPDDIWYENSIKKNASALNIDVDSICLDSDISCKDLIKHIEEANRASDIHGIMVFRPLPDHIDEEEVAIAINYKKDVDAMNPINIGKTFEFDNTSMLPCTAQAVIELLKFYDYDLESKNVTIIGRSQVVGRPLGNLFLNQNSTVSIGHSRTEDLRQLSQNSDIVVSCVGSAEIFDETYFNSSAVIVDVGVNSDEDGKMVGDINYKRVYPHVEAISPVPGGVGTITTSLLLDQVVKACENLNDI